MKNYLIFILILITAAVLAHGCFAEDLSSGDYRYTILLDGTAEILNYQGTESSITIPEAFEEVKISAIGKQAFAYNAALESVIIPEGITAIGDHAFGECTALTSVSVPEGLVWMGDGVFQGCILLERSLFREAWSGSAGTPSTAAMHSASLNFPRRILITASGKASCSTQKRMHWSLIPPG